MCVSVCYSGQEVVPNVELREGPWQKSVLMYEDSGWDKQREANLRVKKKWEREELIKSDLLCVNIQKRTLT